MPTPDPLTAHTFTPMFGFPDICDCGFDATDPIHAGETPSDRPTTPITDTPEDFARALGITPEETPNA